MKSDPRTNIGLLVLRLGIGLVITFYGCQKMFGLFGGHGYVATINTFTTAMNIPPLFAHLAIVAEFCGGLGILLGCLTPVAAFGVLCTMAFATYINASAPDALHALISTGNPADASKILYPLVIGFGAAAIMVMGAGSYSLDAKFFRRSGKR
jgi:putative oxidoreductase